MLSPSHIEKTWTRIESQLLDKCHGLSPRWAPLLGALGLGFLYFFICIPLAQSIASAAFRIDLFLDRKILYAVMTGLALLVYYTPLAWLGTIRFLSLVISWVSACLYIAPVGWSFLLIPLLALSGYLYLRFSTFHRIAKFIGALLFAFLFFYVGYLLAKEAAQSQNTHILRLFWTLHPQMFLLFVLYRGLSQSQSQSQSQGQDQNQSQQGQEKLCLAPTNFAWGVLWPEESRPTPNNKTELRKFWWKGLYNCYLAALLFSLAFFLKKILPGWESQSFANILFQYGYFLLFLIASFNQLAGMSRMFGIDCPDPTHFLVLAKTPMETWQRGSTYLYRFFLRHIFIPLMRFSRHFALASLLSFVLVIGHMFLFQDIVVRGLFVQLVPELRAPPVNILSTVIFSFSWISIWYFWILIGASLWNRILRKFSHPICQWLSVIGNHLVVLSILPITNIYIVPFFLRTFISI